MNCSEKDSESHQSTNGKQRHANVKSPQKPSSLLSQSANRQLVMSLIPIAILILLGSAIIVKGEGWDWIDAIYWCVITGTSVGYGDFHPTTIRMRWFGIFYIPIAVGCYSAALGKIANIFVESEIRKYNSKLLRREVTLEDLETMNVDGGGEVSVLELVEHMLKSMNKVDQLLLDELHEQFHKLDADGSGGLEGDDLLILAERKLSERRRLALERYQSALLHRGATFERISLELNSSAPLSL